MKVARLGGLKDILAGKKTIEVQLDAPQNAEVEELAVLPADEATVTIKMEQLTSALEQLAAHLESQDKKSAAAALRLNGHHVRDGVAYIELMKHEMVIFGEIKQEVLQFIRSATGIPGLKIDFELVLKSRKEAKPFRSKDKLEAMLKSNPNLQTLIDTFGLELED